MRPQIPKFSHLSSVQHSRRRRRSGSPAVFTLVVSTVGSFQNFRICGRKLTRLVRLFLICSELSGVFWVFLSLAVVEMADSGTDPTSGSPDSGNNPDQIQPLRMPTIEEIRAQEVWNNCAVRSVASGVMGGGLGLMMGLFLGALDNPIMQEEMTARQQFIYQARQMGQRSWSSAKTFAVMGLVFSAAECIIEKARAKHDTTNTAVAGCVTGGAMSARGGPKAACVGCAGFAAFSVVIEKFFDSHT